MSDGSSPNDPTTEQWSAFQKIWTDTFGRMIQLGFTASPDAVPPEMLRRLRSGIFEAMSESWDQFLRSPQFLETVRQWMDGALAFRRLSSDFLTKVRHETEGTSRDDILGMLQALRHLEGRILARLDEIGERVEALEAGRRRKTGRNGDAPGGGARPAKRRTTVRQRRQAQGRTP